MKKVVPININTPAPVSERLDHKAILKQLKDGIGYAEIPSAKVPGIIAAGKKLGYSIVTRKSDNDTRKVWKVSQRLTPTVSVTKNVPVPVRYDYDAIFNSLNVGDSFTIHPSEYAGFYQASRKHNVSIMRKKQSNNETRVWRTQ